MLPVRPTPRVLEEIRNLQDLLQGDVSPRGDPRRAEVQLVKGSKLK